MRQKQKDFLESVWSTAADELTGAATTPTKYLRLYEPAQTTTKPDTIFSPGKLLVAEQDSAVCLLWGLELRIVHACLVSSDAWVGGWRGVVETLFGRWPRVLVSYVLSPGLMLQPCMDYIQERDSLDMATEQDDC